MRKPIYLMVSQFFPTPESWRGAFCYDFARAVERTGRYDVRVMVVSRVGGTDYAYHGLPVLRCKDVIGKLNFGRWICHPINRFLFERKLKRANIKPTDIAVVHFHDVDYVPLVRGIKKANPSMQVWLHFHNGGHPFTVAMPRLGVIPIYSTFRYLYCRWGFEMVDVPIFVSARQREMFGRWFPKGLLKPAVPVLKGMIGGGFIRPVRLHNPQVLHNGIDYELFNPKGRQPHEGFVIGCVGNIDPYKDQMTLLRAVVRLRDEIKGLKVVIIGSGVSLLECKDFVERNGLEEVVEFRSEVDHLELPAIYRSFDLFVIPSYLEGFCCSYMEAWGCGTPVMGCKGVCLDEAIVPEEHDKWLIKPKDDEQLARLILAYSQCSIVQHMRHRYDMVEMIGGLVNQIAVQGSQL